MEADIDAESTSIGESRAISNNGVAESSLALSTMGINGSNHLDIEATVRGAQLINAVASSTGFSESAAVSGSASRDLVSSTTNQEALGLNNYSIQTDSFLKLFLPQMYTLEPSQILVLLRFSISIGQSQYLISSKRLD